MKSFIEWEYVDDSVDSSYDWSKDLEPYEPITERELTETPLDRVINFLNEQIQFCDEVGGMEREKNAFVLSLNVFKKHMSNYIFDKEIKIERDYFIPK